MGEVRMKRLKVEPRLRARGLKLGLVAFEQ